MGDSAREKPFSPSCERNRDPILDVLRLHFADRRKILEIGSGTGQHAVYFATGMPHLSWQTADREENHAGITAWLHDEGPVNALAPFALDVNDVSWTEGRGPYDGVFTANTLHIMGWKEVEKLFMQLPQVLAERATVVAYGPFNYGGKFTSESNERFQQTLKSWGRQMGIRDFEAVDELARAAGLSLVEDRAMPANNRCLVWTCSP